MIAEAKTAADYAAIVEYYEHAAQSAREDLHRYERERSSAAKQIGPVRHSGSIAFRTASIAHAEQRASECEERSAYRERVNALRLQNPDTSRMGQGGIE